ncbi:MULTISPECIES: hypothetical protein [Pseudomonas]|uniref:Nmad2 family putative nucleotide modification protein n=1 Tax=Pseudomonas guariconensis TaxID=1288410 RepID=UPI002097AD3C|nr:MULTISPECIES: hypothetical protein [Pseudomonas]MCO7593045.1 hypothetical protein [Pseudomonas guariconensis]MCU7219703.1 hypothetical protein [Pseudomonas brassicacearum]
MANVFMYVVDRDFGFAPNPFHGLCTLATCKPITRRVAKVGDWVIGMGGGRLKATGKCVFAMKVSRRETFDSYWSNPDYKDKKPLRNGSKKMIVGDNIYWRENGEWQQLNSHHSFPDGSPNPHNIKNDTQTDAVLISEYFYYFGSGAVEIPGKILSDVGYVNGRSHRKFSLNRAQPLIEYIENGFERNILYGDPFDFESAKSRYSAENNKVTA